ncbi:IclR family transcriptional regulator [Actinomadura sp. NPDC047616]|uniref:IclR family transcriptional regulator n=1 Tax=Actinomadura sp. NPDC047616 TaxID=3155914 RepID=UPI00340EDD35
MSRPEMDVASKPVSEALPAHAGTAAPAGAAGTPREATGTAKALVKGLALVDLIATGGPRRLTDLVTATGVPRGTVVRLLEVLVAHEVLRADASGRYDLGPQLAVWGQGFLGRLDVRAQAADLMRELTEQTRETCFLGVRRGAQVLYIAKTDSPQAVRPAAVEGSVNPLHCTGIGKALLAHSDEEVVRDYLAGPLERRTPNTITDAQALAAELAEVRERGYAIDEIENEEGVRCVAAPVRDHGGRVVAALSVSAPAYRFPREEMPGVARRLLAAAATLSARLGHRAPQQTEEIS